MSFDPHALKIYIDGSCFHNPGGHGGFAAWVEYPSKDDLLDERLEEVGFYETTNNRMELRACIWAHEWVSQHAPSMRVSRIQIITDSQYVYKFWRRAEQWKRDGWRLGSGRPAENADLWKKLLSIRSKLRVRVDIEWTPGKKTLITKAVDKSAKQAAKRPSEVDHGFVAGKIGRTRNKTSGTAALFPAAGQESMILIYQTAAYRRRAGENKLKFQEFSEVLRDFSTKFVAYASPELGCLLHRGRAYRVQFNSDRKYPVVVEVLEEFPTADDYLKRFSQVEGNSRL